MKSKPSVTPEQAFTEAATRLVLASAVPRLAAMFAALHQAFPAPLTALRLGVLVGGDAPIPPLNIGRSLARIPASVVRKIDVFPSEFSGARSAYVFADAFMRSIAERLDAPAAAASDPGSAAPPAAQGRLDPPDVPELITSIASDLVASALSGEPRRGSLRASVFRLREEIAFSSDCGLGWDEIADVLTAGGIAVQPERLQILFDSLPG
jgi:hypothetical protein